MSRKVSFLSLILAFLCAGVVTMTSCNEDDPEPEAPFAASLQLVSGGEQNSIVETALGNAVEVKVTDQHGDAIAGTTVTFSVAEGSISNSSATSDAQGKASTMWTLGATEGEQILSVSALGADGATALTGSPISVKSTGSPVPLVATNIELVSGGSQSATVETELAEVIVVLVKDQNAAPLSGAEVSFTTGDGSGLASVATTTTDAEGKANVSWTIGATVGEQTLTATSGEVSIGVTSIGKEALVATGISIVDGNNQSATVETELTEAIVVLVKDQNDAPLSGATVSFTTNDGSGSPFMATATSDADGKASVSWTLGTTVGAQTLTATSGGTSVQVTAIGIEVKVATSLVLESGGDQSGRAGAKLTNPVVIKVTDQSGAPFQGATVTFTVTEGNVGTSTVKTIDATTDATGMANVNWTLGTTEGAQTLTITTMAADGVTPLSGAPINVTATATVSNIVYGSMTDIDGNTYQTVTIGTQEWMAENLRVTQTFDGTAIDLITDYTAWADLGDNTTDAAYSFYNNDSDSYASTYGALYSYAAAKNACPVDWHLPSDAEWKTLEVYLGISQADADLTGSSRGIDQGTTLKSLSGWRNDTNGTDDYGFNAYPAGERSIGRGAFYDGGNRACWWTSTELFGSQAYYREMYYENSTISRYYYNMSKGQSVRCVKD